MTAESVSDPITVGDALPPLVVSIVRASANPSSAPSVDFTVTFSTPVDGVDELDFTPLTSGTVSGALISAVNGADETYRVTVNNFTGAGALGLAVVDNDTIVDADVPTMPLGGPGLLNGDFTTGETYTVDYTPPMVVSSMRLSTNPTTLSAVYFKVTFSESVMGVDNTDFSLTTTMTGASIASVTGTGATRTVRVNTGTGTGTPGCGR
jgi:hypothetical protein